MPFPDGHVWFDHAFLWKGGCWQDLGVLPGCISSGGSAINELGQVVGSSISLTNDILTYQHAFLWQDGVMTDLGTLGGSFSQPYDINDLGQVVGESTTADGSAHAFLWDGGTMCDLGTLGGMQSCARGINNRGQIVGFSYTPGVDSHAVIWQNGAITDLGTLSGCTTSAAFDVNDLGLVAGGSPVFKPCRAVLWEPVPEPSSIITLAGGLGSLLALRRRRS